ncbi:MAG: isoprenylcysteine carboxylmethyltransferase family protein [Candidatus Omnitrophota bacterium]
MTKIKTIPPVFFISFLISAFALQHLAPFSQMIRPPWNYSGLILIGLGVAAAAWARYLFIANKTTVNPHEAPVRLQVAGPFRISRNPMYLAMTTILLGIAVMLGSVSVFVCPIGFALVMNNLFIPLEENKLQSVFGEKYLLYKKRVRRWL